MFCGFVFNYARGCDGLAVWFGIIGASNVFSCCEGAHVYTHKFAKWVIVVRFAIVYLALPMVSIDTKRVFTIDLSICAPSRIKSLNASPIYSDLFEQCTVRKNNVVFADILCSPKII